MALSSPISPSYGGVGPALSPALFDIGVVSLRRFAIYLLALLSILSVRADDFTLLAPSLDSASVPFVPLKKCGVLRSELMPTTAMGFVGVNGWESDSPKYVLFRGNDLKVIRINTFPVSAQVVGVKPLWDWPLEVLVGVSVPKAELSTFVLIAKSSIPLTHDICVPLPAPCVWINGKAVHELIMDNLRVFHNANIVPIGTI